MEDSSRVREWIEAGKQVGKYDFIGEGDERYLLSIGVQKWEGEYKLYLFKANEVKLRDIDYYDFEGTIKVTHLEELKHLISVLCPFNFSELTPIKGQKIFNPAFD
ncbi:hypothetical protein [Hymenobacter sp. IS2118]|uniref:hypothetical protein n=1 Tax=Hymenobacter sp. IS2118 TaxID=1505605 RepID=UPI00054DA24F|nr:hypothetical protein [Hymenobacter sp. IS2118]